MKNNTDYINDIQKHLDDLSFVIHKTFSKYYYRKGYDIPEDELDKPIKDIDFKIFQISELIKNLNWDYKSNRKFEHLNTLLLVVPTFLGAILIGLIIFSKPKVEGIVMPETESLNTGALSLNDTLSFYKRDINQKKIQIDHLEETNKHLQKIISDGSKVEIFELNGKEKNINLKNTNANFIILKNILEEELKFNLTKTTNNITVDNLFYSAPLSNHAIGNIHKNEVLIISVKELENINSEIKVQFNTIENPNNKFFTITISPR